MELLIAGVPKSGTTMLANLLTRPPSRIVLGEPNLGARSVGIKTVIAKEIEAFGGPADLSTERELLNWLESLERWGVKEVQGCEIERTWRTFEPRKVLVIVRDLRHAALSMFERMVRFGEHNEEKRIRWQVDSARQILRLLEAVPSERLVIVRYEDFCSSSALRRQIAEAIDWDLDGCLYRGLRELWGRGYEIGRHLGEVTDASLKLRESQLTGRQPVHAGALALAERLSDSCPEYQLRFGY